ncbi:hypothetical protein B0H14DRAFT_3103799 [Mycena olivaceomarginata]|nr:hypothetical protein B0H14DRAFT_3103799 [Mycena olivaceomarginata]
MLHRLSLPCRSFKTTFSTCAARLRPPNGALTGSAKLFADAAQEEAESESAAPQRVPAKPDDLNWTGDERLEDTVLRMLLDKYKPLRTGTIQTAEQKLRKSPPRVQEYRPDTPSPSPVNSPPPGSSWADVPLLAGSADHRPWHTEFKVPEHAKSSIKFGHFPLPSHTARTTHTGDLEQSRKTEKEFNKTLGRIIGARESTLDYRLGLGPHAKRAGPRVNPVNMKGWTSLIEDRIEQARRAGVFAAVKGRGRPIARAPEESNPFIGREEFLMNRIVRRNGAAPPWVQLQAELDAALGTFRALLHAGWTRHAVRAVTLHGVGARAGDGDGDAAFRDPAWARREAAYHAAALAEVNERLAGTYERAGADVARAVAERAAKAHLRAAGDGHPEGRPGGRHAMYFFLHSLRS